MAQWMQSEVKFGIWNLEWLYCPSAALRAGGLKVCFFWVAPGNRTERDACWRD